MVNNSYSFTSILLALTVATTLPAATSANRHHKHAPNLRSDEQTTSAQALPGGKGKDEDLEVHCGMTVPKGKKLTLTKDLTCGQFSPNWVGGLIDQRVAIKLEAGAELDCNGHSLVS